MIVCNKTSLDYLLDSRTAVSEFSVFVGYSWLNFSINLNYVVVFVLQDSTMNSPRGLIVLKDSRVILCGFGSDNIQLIDENGVLIKDLLTRTDGIMGPQVMALNSACDTIAVTFDPSSGMGETVKIFRLKV